MKAKALVDTLAEGQAEAEVKRIGDTLVKVEAYKEAGETSRGQAIRVLGKIDNLGETLVLVEAERLVDTL